MTEEEVLSELRTIRNLLALDKASELQDLIDDLDTKQNRILEELSYDDWTKSSEFKSEIAKEFDVTNETIRTKLADLAEMNLIERQGEGSATKYRKSKMLQTANRLISS